MPITLQEAFTRIYTYYIIDRNGPCRTTDNTGESLCAYADNKGNRCLIGLLLPDDFAFERDQDRFLPLKDLMRHYPSVKKHFNFIDWKKLRHLQHTHDVLSKLERPVFYKKMKERLDEFSNRNKLKRPVTGKLPKREWN